MEQALPASAALKASFAPITDAGTRLLVLGSLPGEVSLRHAQYYAHPQNQFWRLMGEVVGADLAGAGYEARLAMLRGSGVGLWDVVRTARRAGSLDTAIRDHQPNALAELAAALPALRAIAFNGGKAAEIGRASLIRSGMGADSRWTLVDLPSSSPAYTIGYERKRIAWLELTPFLSP